MGTREVLCFDVFDIITKALDKEGIKWVSTLDMNPETRESMGFEEGVMFIQDHSIGAVMRLRIEVLNSRGHVDKPT